MLQAFKIDTITCAATYTWLSHHAVCQLKKDKLLKADLSFSLGFEIHSLVFSIHFNPSFQQNCLNLKCLH